MASHILERAWAPEGDIAFPVDPVLIAQSLGVKVFLSELPEGVSGALVKKGGGPTILLNSRHHANRQRFTCAHELGHYLQRSARDANADYEYVDWRDPRASEGTEPEEIYANAFAAALLMPRNEVVSRHRKGMGAAELAIDFRVSVEAAQNRLDDLRAQHT